MAASLTSSTFTSSISLRGISLRQNHRQPVWFSVSKPLKFPTIRTMAVEEAEFKQVAGDIMDDVKEKLLELKENVTDLAGKAGNEAGELKDKADKSAQETGNCLANKAEEGKKIAEDLKDKSLNAAGTAAEKTEKAVEGARDAVKGAVAKE